MEKQPILTKYYSAMGWIESGNNFLTSIPASILFEKDDLDLRWK